MRTLDRRDVAADRLLASQSLLLKYGLRACDFGACHLISKKRKIQSTIEELIERTQQHHSSPKLNRLLNQTFLLDVLPEIFACNAYRPKQMAERDTLLSSELSESHIMMFKRGVILCCQPHHQIVVNVHRILLMFLCRYSEQ